MAVVNLGNSNDLWEAFQQNLAFEPNTVNAGGGDDFIVSGTMNDTINGGDGNDLLFGISGNDTLNGDAGDDILDGGNGSDTLAGGAGVDTYLIDFPDSEFGMDTIVDTDGILKVGYTNFDINTGTYQTFAYQIAGTPVLVNAATNLYQLTVLDTSGNPVVYNIEWNGTNGSNLTIWSTAVPRSQVSVVIQGFNDNTFGLSFVAPNTAPVANNDAGTVVENSTTGVVINVLANDTDSDGTVNPATVTIGTNPAHGTVSVNATTGAITYVPTAGYVGTDSFTYTVQDNDGTVSNVATVSLNVTDSAIHLTPNGDFFEAFSQGMGNQNIEIYGEDGNDVIITGFGNDYIEGGNGNDTLYSYNGNDTVKGGAGNDTIEAGSGVNVVEGGADADTYVIGFSGTGTTSITDDNGILFLGTINPSTGMPVGVQFTGTATQTSAGNYSLTVGANTYNLAWTGGNLVITQTNGTNPHVYTVNNYVNGTFGLNLVVPNVAPVANNDSANVVENSATGVVINVLTNDTDSDGTLNATTVTIGTNPAHGTVSVNATTGAITYVPTTGYVGTDSFTYTVQDNDGTVSNVATVSLNVTDSAIYLTENMDVFSAHPTYGNTVNEIHALGGNDIVVGGSNTDTIYGDAGNDVLFGNSGSDALYGGEGDDTMDTASGINTAEGGAGNDTYVVEFTDAGSTTITDDNGTIVIGTISQSTWTAQGTTFAGTATQTSAGNYALTLGANTYNLAWTGSNLVITQTNVANPHVVTINNFVNGTFGLNLVLPNAAPVAADDSANVLEDSTTGVVINVLSNDTDSDGTVNSATVVIGNSPSHGTVSVNATTGAITYIPTAGYSGTDIFTYTVQDDDGTVSNAATVTVNVADLTVILTNNVDFWEAFSQGRGFANNIINALDGNDIVVGGSGNDTINGDGGNDVLFGNGGADVINGGAGNDIIDASNAGANGVNLVNGGADADTYVVEFTDTGSTQITDDNGTIVIGTVNQSTFQAQGTTLAGDAIQQSNGTYLLTLGANQYSMVLAGGNLTITQVGGTHSVVINSFVSGTFGINLVVPNVAPVANNDAATLLANTSAVINVLTNDTDSDGTLNTGSVSIVGNPAHGIVSVNATTGAVTYTPTAGYVGTDSFTYSVLDNNGAVSNTATVNLTVNEQPTTPVTNLTNGNNYYVGTDAAQNVNGLDGHDFIYLKGGDDNVSGGNGCDFIDGGTGNDTINGDAGSDLIFGGSGNDTINGGDDTDIIDGGSDNDTISGGNGNDFITGGSGNDTVNGDAGNDLLDGGLGNDIINGGSGNDTILGGAGNDTITGGAGRDFIWGNSGADIFRFDSISDSSASARDSIEDFTRGLDKISIGSAIAADFSGLIIQQVADGVNVTDVNSTFSIHIDHVTTLNASDFMFS